MRLLSVDSKNEKECRAMKCQYCNQNEANNSFIVKDFMNQQHQVHLCSDCVSKFQKYVTDMNAKYNNGQQLPMGWGYTSTYSSARAVDEDNFPIDAGAEIKQRRRLNQLYFQLKKAASKEEYEKAGQLRDEIKKLEKKV